MPAESRGALYPEADADDRFLKWYRGRSWTAHKRKNSELMNDDGKMTVYIGNSARKTKMIPILRDLVMGVRRKERGIRVFECSEAEIHLARPLAVHVDGESCMCQENLAVRCIPKRMRVIGS